MVVGDLEVGKSSIVEYIKSNKFSEKYVPTKDYNCIQIELKLNKNKYDFLFIDFSGKYKIDKIKKFSKRTMGIILVYDITNEKSFKYIDDLLNSFAGSDLGKIPKMLLGNKSDLDKDRKVKYEEGYAFNEKKGMSFFGTSPKDGWGVDDAYEIFLDNVEKYFKDYIKNNLEKPKNNFLENQGNYNLEKAEIKPKEELKKKTNKEKSGCCDCFK